MTKRTSTKLATRLGRAIAIRRKELGLTQDSLSERVGVDKETISRFERGVTLPSLTTLEILAAQLETTIAELLAEEAPRPLDEAQTISSWMALLKGKHRKFLLDLVRLYCEQHR